MPTTPSGLPFPLGLLNAVGGLSLTEAINEILITSILPPIQDFNQVTTSVQGASALRLLMAVSREVQARPWEFNRVFNVKLVPDSNGLVAVPADAISCRFEGGSLMVRSGYVYDRFNGTTTFTQPLIATEIKVLLGWDDLPYAAQRYITARASRRFATGRLGSQEAIKILQDDERQAWLLLEQTDSTLGEASSRYKPGHLNRWKNRRP